MPYKTIYVEPPVFAIIDNLVVYHTYRNNIVEDGFSTFVYTLDPLTHDHHFSIEHLEVPAADDLLDHPDYANEVGNPRWTKLSISEKEILRERWAQWWRADQPRIIKQILTEAIAAGFIKKPKGI